MGTVEKNLDIHLITYKWFGLMVKKNCCCNLFHFLVYNNEICFIPFKHTLFKV